MFRIDNTSAATTLPTPAAPGTAGYFTGGDPVGGTPATIVTADWLNAVQEEITHVVEQVGLTPSKTDRTQLFQAIQAIATGLGLRLAHGECRLVYTSATTITLKPLNGCALLINGVQQEIPAGGITGSNAGLSANTVYMVYAHIVSGAIALQFSLTPHATDTSALNNGVEIMQGNAQYTLVGMVRTNASSQFQHDGLQYNGVASWFNRRRTVASYSNPSNVTFSQITTGLVPGYQIGFLLWGDGGVALSAGGGCSSSVVGGSMTFAAAIDSITSGTANSFQVYQAAAGSNHGFACVVSVAQGVLVEGWHNGNMLGACSGGGATVTVNGSQCRINVETEA